MSNPTLQFISNPSNEGEGLSDAGVETFRDRPYFSVAREAGQNSRDAQADVNQPVKMVFKEHLIDTRDFPSHDEYLKVINLCLNKSTLSEKEKSFFENAKQLLSKPKVKVLEISDSNTVGVEGPCEEGKPFYAFAKADGVSQNRVDTSGGSFGIGKNAAYSASDLQSVFISTKYKTEDDTQFLCIGKSLFVSHTGADGQPKRRKGYWSNENFMPIDDENQVPTWLRRESIGTSIFILCMRDESWVDEVCSAILINFFVAIHKNKMDFEIKPLDGSSITLNTNTLGQHIEDLFSKREDLEMVAEIERVHNLYKVLQSPNTQNVEVSSGNPKIKMALQILVDSNLNNEIGIFRNEMYITHNFKNFDQPYTRFPLCKKFAAILQPVTEETKKLLRKTEGPRHDDFSSDRILDPQDRSQAKATISKLAKEIREQIKALTKYERISHNSINELNRFFDPSVDTDTEGQAIDDSPNPGEASEIRRKSLEQKKKTHPDPTGSQTGPTSENKGKGEGKGRRMSGEDTGGG
mgnify:CR=1 FL=1